MAWKEVPGTPGRFVNKSGKTKGKRGRLIKTHPHDILITFVGPRPPGQLARHLNDDPTDNRAVNLAWGTTSDNWADARRNGKVRMGETNPNAKLSDSDLADIRARHVPGHGGNTKALAEEYGISRGNMLNRISGKTTNDAAREAAYRRGWDDCHASLTVAV